MKICQLAKLSKGYGEEERVSVLNNLDLEINRGDFISIEGTSGVGKSTLLYVIGTLLRGEGGKMYLYERDVSSMSDRELTVLRAHKLGFIFQESTLLQAFTAKENLEFAMRLGTTKLGSEGRVEAWLDRVGLTERANFLPCQLSGGQRRRLMVARALINRPALILADEPSNDLDEYWGCQVMELLSAAAREGAAVVLATHNQAAWKQATARYQLYDGKLRRCMQPPR